MPLYDFDALGMRDGTKDMGKLRSGEHLREICPISKIEDILDEGSKIVDFFGRMVHVYKRNGNPTALINTCMDFGVPLDFHTDGCKFVCQRHNSEFDTGGQRMKGPPPRTQN